MTLDAPSVTVEPGTSASVPFHVAVPGCRTGRSCVRAPHGVEGRRGGLSVDRRLGTVVDVRVTGPVRPALTIEGLEVRADEALVPTSALG
ncbi:hypothetical protein NKG05_13690 [Oerskovia sp. M15]